MELSSLQKQLYQQVVDTTLQQIEILEETAFERKGLVLKLLIQLKQILNHPYQYLHLQFDQFEANNLEAEITDCWTFPK